MVRSSQVIQALVFAWVGLLAFPALAADFHPARTAGLGGAGRAGPLMNDGVYLNPSFLAFLKSYTLGGQYAAYKGDTNGRILHASLQDGSSDLFAAAFGYTVRQDAKFFHVGVGKAIAPLLSVGLGGKVLIRPNGQKWLMDANFGATYIVSPVLQLAFTVDNILETETKANEGLLREFAIGSRVNIDNIWIIYFDPHLATTAEDPFGVEIGMEFKMFTDLTLKLGHFRASQIPYLNERGKGYSIGAGWVGPRLSLDAALTRTIEPVGTSAATLGFTVFF